MVYAGDEELLIGSAGEVFEVGGGGTKVVSVKLNASLVRELDMLWRKLGYSSRSQFIREAIIYYMMVVRTVREKNLCVCNCSECPGARKLEDVLAESVADTELEANETEVDIL